MWSQKGLNKQVITPGVKKIMFSRTSDCTNSWAGYLAGLLFSKTLIWSITYFLHIYIYMQILCSWPEWSSTHQHQTVYHEGWTWWCWQETLLRCGIQPSSWISTMTIIPKKIFHWWQQGLPKLSQHLQQNLASHNRSFCPNLL